MPVSSPYNPTLKRGATILQLNQSVAGSSGLGELNLVDESYPKRMRKTEVPLRAGAILSGVARSAGTVAVGGFIYGTSRADLYDKKNSLQGFLVENDLAFEFYRFRDTVNSYYRWWKDCRLDNLNFGNTSRTRLYIPYTFTFTAPDGKELVSGTFPDEGAGSGNDPGVDPTPDDDEIELEGNTIFQFADAAGASTADFVDSNNNVVARITSAGDLIYKGNAYADENLS